MLVKTFFFLQCRSGVNNSPHPLPDVNSGRRGNNPQEIGSVSLRLSKVSRCSDIIWTVLTEHFR